MIIIPELSISASKQDKCFSLYCVKPMYVALFLDNVLSGVGFCPFLVLSGVVLSCSLYYQVLVIVLP